MEGPSVGVAATAAVPVLLWWWIILRVLPSAFREFAIRYMSNHPEVVPTDAQHAAEVHEKE
eukprot:354096-Chlamydomonas_euryale.AAC.2